MIRIVKGSIVEIDADAIVNPANSMGVMGGGVAGAIKKYGGAVIEKEAMAKAPIRIGEAVETSAGRLACQYVIHSPTMERPAMRIGAENVYLATKAALQKAFELKLRKIAIPGMGTGVGGVPYEDAAKEMIRAIREFEQKFDEIILVDINESMIKAWRAVVGCKNDNRRSMKL